MTKQTIINIAAAFINPTPGFPKNADAFLGKPSPPPQGEGGDHSLFKIFFPSACNS